MVELLHGSTRLNHMQGTVRFSVWFRLIMDIAVAGFYMVYALIYNWAYDAIFPIPNATPRDCAADCP